MIQYNRIAKYGVFLFTVVHAIHTTYLHKRTHTGTGMYAHTNSNSVIFALNNN